MCEIKIDDEQYNFNCNEICKSNLQIKLDFGSQFDLQKERKENLNINGCFHQFYSPKVERKLIKF